MTRLATRLTIVFCPALAITLATSAALSAADARPDELALAAREVFKTHCHRCHHGPGDNGDFDVLVDATLKAPPTDKDKQPYVVPGKPEQSWIVERITKGEMPPKEIRERPTPEQIETVRKWVAAGAPAYPAAVRPFVSVEQSLAAVRDDLNRADLADRPFLRYFSITSLHNNKALPERDLRLARAAVAKAANSLSWKRRIVLPRAVDPQQTILAIDVRQLDWDRNDLWKELIAGYPYGVSHRENETLQSLEKDIATATRSSLPIVRGDWFVAVATRPPLYHVLLQLPQTAGELERRLDVNFRINFDRDQLARAGFFPSLVSKQNRLLERHDAAHGAYWKSYDFKPKNPNGNLKRQPLGPRFAGNPFADQAFAHNGGEIIFNLPNGLQGYMLVDGNDQRINDGPPDVVQDDQQTSGSPIIVNGLSCISCHKDGMKEFKDQIREGTAVFGDAQQKVRKLFPPDKDMRRLIGTDQQLFLRALKDATGPFLLVGEDAEKPITAFVEPVGETARFYALAGLDLQAVASELEVEKPETLLQTIGENRLRELGLSVLTAGGRLSREDWDSGQGMSLMQRASRELGRAPIEVNRIR